MQLLIWSGAFVEPDENQIKKTTLINKLRIFSAGSIANIAVVVAFLLVTQNLLWPLFVPGGLMITGVVEGAGAATAGLKPGMVLQKIGDTDVSVGYGIFAASYGYILFKGYNLTSGNVGNLSTFVELATILSEFKPNQTIQVQANGTIYDLMLTGRPENASLPYMGIETASPIKSDFMFEFTFPLIWWLTTLGYLVATFNLLPIYPLDGGLILEAVVEKVHKKSARKIVNIVTAIILALLVFGFVGPSIISAF
jgi:membrane-associated protease RseP (regulator of RpoE activity)